ncbi:16S rRNA (cytidine(1402)-2'-O)-methyltransferase [Kallipyga massiliensis]|uniref:16S rRNA (cytidine(1402)-2'-O)-methyltransferase n=1 Tax=Kallipyga massiliensis TaxID=1472764 RepID=UPI0026EFAACB|nr:16S rRNA (cytidine(1402)-2'-O)-methyltransferase [Kallipyga massiliensis]
MPANDGILIVVPTPIGNREDITLRALRALREADLIACEDTRHSGLLMEFYEVHAPLISYEKFNEEARSGDILDRVAEGKKVCLVSDAGMPGISDPGAILIRHAIDRGLPFTVLPGPSAADTCFVASGLGEGTYAFLGFLPRKGKERREALESLDRMEMAAVIYEAPHRIRKTLEEFGQRWPERRMALLREWTKTYEERQSFLGKEAGDLDVVEKGEFVLVLEGAEPNEESPGMDQVMDRLRTLIDQGRSTKDAVKEVAEWSGLAKNDLYQEALNITKKK